MPTPTIFASANGASRQLPTVSRHNGAPLAVRRLRLVCMAIAIALYIAMAAFGPERILPSQANDAATIANLVTSVDSIEAGDGYATMALIYSVTTAYMRQAMLLLISVMFFYSIMRYIKGIPTAVISFFMIVSPILLTLCFFVKDALYIPFIIIFLYFSRYVRLDIVFLFFSSTLLVIFAILFRNYFVIVIATFLFLYVFRASSGFFRFLIILAIPVILLVIPPTIYTFLQEQRDWVNAGRIGLSGSGNRTAFMNYMRPEGLYSFLVNYGYATLRLNAPILFGTGLKEVFHMASVLTLAALAIFGLRSSNPIIWRPALLFCAHFLTLMLFEPDVGSYLRHITASAPLVGPALGLIAFTVKKRTPPKIGKTHSATLSRQPRRLARNNSGHL